MPQDMGKCVELFPNSDEIKDLKCDNILSHKCYLLSPDLLNEWGIRFNIVKQEEG